MNKKTFVNYTCANCQYSTTRKSSYINHINSKKHLEINVNEVLPPDVEEQPDQQQGDITNPITSTVLDQPHLLYEILQENQQFKQLIIDVVKSNAELQKQCSEFQKQFMDAQLKNQEIQQQMVDVCKNSTTTNTINNGSNNTFNMQVFLNEHCKDAMNLKDFIDSMVLSLDDLELIGLKGFVEGISKIITGNLRKTDVNLRPIHCTDVKREVMYIKENDKWSKESPKNENIRRFVQFIEMKNIRLLGAYVDEHPDCMESDSPFNDHYLMLTAKSTSATAEHLDKVISKIAREVFIDKSLTL